MNLVISKCVTAVILSNVSGQYLRNRSTLDIGILGYIGIVQHNEHSSEVLSIPPGTPCIYITLRYKKLLLIYICFTLVGLNNKLKSKLFSHLRLGLPGGLFLSGKHTKTLFAPLLFSIHATFPAHPILLDLIIRIIFGEECRL